jgi:hypothetical protein
MVFTSPPYFKTVRPIEDYAHMPRYADRADFNARFLFPVIRSTYAHMARGGTYALNIPDDMYDEIRAAGILPSRLLAKHRLFLQVQLNFAHTVWRLVCMTSVAIH